MYVSNYTIQVINSNHKSPKWISIISTIILFLYKNWKCKMQNDLFFFFFTWFWNSRNFILNGKNTANYQQECQSLQHRKFPMFQIHHSIFAIHSIYLKEQVYSILIFHFNWNWIYPKFKKFCDLCIIEKSRKEFLFLK